MPTEVMTIDVRAELVSGLIACLQGLDAQYLNMRVSMPVLAAILDESTVLNPRFHIRKHPELDTAWTSADFEDDCQTRWHVTAPVSMTVYREFAAANPQRVADSDDHTELTAMEMALTMRKEMARK